MQCWKACQNAQACRYHTIYLRRLQHHRLVGYGGSRLRFLPPAQYRILIHTAHTERYSLRILLLDGTTGIVRATMEIAPHARCWCPCPSVTCSSTKAQ